MYFSKTAQKNKKRREAAKKKKDEEQEENVGNKVQTNGGLSHQDKDSYKVSIYIYYIYFVVGLSICLFVTDKRQKRLNRLGPNCVWDLT